MAQPDDEILAETDDRLDVSEDGWSWTTEAGRWRPGDDARRTP